MIKGNLADDYFKLLSCALINWSPFSVLSVQRRRMKEPHLTLPMPEQILVTHGSDPAACIAFSLVGSLIILEGLLPARFILEYSGVLGLAT